jgi:hypothetical protein
VFVNIQTHQMPLVDVCFSDLGCGFYQVAGRAAGSNMSQQQSLVRPCGPATGVDSGQGRSQLLR